MDSTRDGRGLRQAREANARLSARVRRVSLLWWVAAPVVLFLLNLTTEPPEAWPIDLVGYAGGSLLGFGWSLLVARRLTYERRRLRHEAVWEGLGLAVLGGGLCGAVVGVLNLCAGDDLKLDASAVAQVSASVGSYTGLCVGWCFIYFVLSGAERLSRIEEKLSALRVVAYDLQRELFRDQFRLDFARNIFPELDGFLSQHRQPESQNVVLAVAAKLRDALDRWREVAGTAEPPEVSAGEAAMGDADFSAPDLVVRAVMNLKVANIIFWFAIFAFFLVTEGPYYVVGAGVRGGLSCFFCWLAFGVTGCIACVVLESVSAFLSARRWWVKCVYMAIFSLVSSYVSACFPYMVWLAIARHKADIQPFLTFAFYFSCSYVVWYCLYFYAQAVRREVAQRAVLAQAAEAAAAARNSLLRYRVRPHFLFNALNALYALIADRRWAEAQAMARTLSQYIERAFARDERELVPIGEQVEALRAYLGLETIRFGDRLRFRADIPERLAYACAPSLICTRWSRTP